MDKPAGVLSRPAREGDKDPRLVLGLELQKSLDIQIFPVHRLDFEVSGLVMYALNAKAHSVANSWFEKKMISKTYRAWTLASSFDHIPPQIENSRQHLELVIGKTYQWHNKIHKGKKRAFVSPHGKESHTLAKFLDQTSDEIDLQMEAVLSTKFADLPQVFRWDLNPVTGRSHQLRFELSHRGFPIMGDALYGSKIQFPKSDALALRAWKLDLSDILEKERMGLPKTITTFSSLTW